MGRWADGDPAQPDLRWHKRLEGAPGVWAGFGGGLMVASVLLVRRLWKVTGERGEATEAVEAL